MDFLDRFLYNLLNYIQLHVVTNAPYATRIITLLNQIVEFNQNAIMLRDLMQFVREKILKKILIK